MAKSNAPESTLLSAARRLADDLSRFESLSLELSRLSINSEKSLQRARQSLEACSEHETVLAQSLQQFAQAMQGMQETQQRCVELTGEAAQRITTRLAERTQLQTRLASLGENARAVSAPVAELVERGATESSDLLLPLQEVERRLDAVIAEAGELCELAQVGDWSDLSRDTQALRDQLQALRNRVMLMRRKLANTAPS